MATQNRYYIKPSCPGSNSYSVFERGAKHGSIERFCAVPMVALYEAKQCCANLNAGNEAWDWLGNSLVIHDSHYSAVALRGL